MSNDGIITLPDAYYGLPSAFVAMYTTNPAMDLTIDDWETIPFNSEAADLSADFNSSTGVFTAPSDGIYALSASVLLTNVDRVNTELRVAITTSNYSYIKFIPIHNYDSGSDPDYSTSVDLSIVCDMDAADTAYVQVYQGGGTIAADVDNSHSWFSGCLLQRY